MLKINFVFQEYPVFYQSYIPPVVETLQQQEDVLLQLNIYRGRASKGMIKMPFYNFRRILEFVFQLFKSAPVKLGYLEILSLKNHVDILHVKDSFLHPKVYGLLSLPKANRPKIVITLRGSDTYVKPWVLKKWSDFFEKQAKKVDAFVVMSEHQKTYLHIKWGVSLENIHVIPISFGNESNAEPKKINNTIITIVSAFRMCWEKNIDGNLRVIKHLKNKGYKVCYHLYGDGPDVGQVYYLLDKYNLKDEVFYHGKIEHSNLKKEYLKADFYLQLSYSESLGMSVIEAQSLGLPAIVSDSGGLPEVIAPNNSGYCVPAYDSKLAADYIAKLWEDHKAYTLFSKKAIEHANSNFTTSKEVHKLMALYHHLITVN